MDIIRRITIFEKTLIFLIPLVLSLCVPCFGDEAVEVEKNVPFFTSPQFDSAPVFVTTAAGGVPVSGTAEIYFGYGSIMKKIRIFQTYIPGEKRDLYFSNDLKYQDYRGGKEIYFSFQRDMRFFAISMLFLIAGGWLFYLFLKRRKTPDLQDEKTSWTVKYMIPAGAVLCCYYAMTSYWFSQTGWIMTRPTDELSYFAIAGDILSGSPSFVWDYTIGNSLFYIPFIVLSGGETYTGAMLPIVLFNGLVTTPAMLLLVMLIVYRFTRSERRSLGCAMSWLALVFLYNYEDIWSIKTLMPVYHRAFADAPVFFDHYRIYQKLIMTGFNGMSDTPAACLALGVICVLLYLRRPFVLSVAMFAVLCLFRINYIFLAPLVLFLLVYAYREKLVSLKAWAVFICSGAVLFLAVFGIQFLLNMHFFGNMLTFPYAVHDDGSDKGFVIRYFHIGMNFLLSSNFAYFVSGAAALPFVKDRFARTTAALAFIPLLMFFCGYPVISNNAVRFLLFCLPWTLIAFASAGIWGGTLKNSFLLVSAVAAAVLLASPAWYGECAVMPWRLQRYGCGMTVSLLLAAFAFVLCAVAAFMVRKEKEILLFMLLFIVLYFSGCAYLTGAVLAVMMCFAFRDAFKLCIRKNTGEELL